MKLKCVHDRDPKFGDKTNLTLGKIYHGDIIVAPNGEACMVVYTDAKRWQWIDPNQFVPADDQDEESTIDKD